MSYHVTCAKCGKQIQLATKAGPCPKCGVLLKLEWPAKYEAKR